MSHRAEIERGHVNEKLSPEEIRSNKNKRAKTRSEARQAKRRQDAEARNAKWASLSMSQQLCELAKRPGQCKRQVAKYF